MTSLDFKKHSVDYGLHEYIV